MTTGPAAGQPRVSRAERRSWALGSCPLPMTSAAEFVTYSVHDMTDTGAPLHICPIITLAGLEAQVAECISRGNDVYNASKTRRPGAYHLTSKLYRFRIESEMLGLNVKSANVELSTMDWCVHTLSTTGSDVNSASKLPTSSSSCTTGCHGGVTSRRISASQETPAKNGWSRSSCAPREPRRSVGLNVSSPQISDAASGGISAGIIVPTEPGVMIFFTIISRLSSKNGCVPVSIS